MGLDDAKVKFGMDIDYLRSEMNQQFAHKINSRILDSEESARIGLDSKISTALARENEMMIKRTTELV